MPRLSDFGGSYWKADHLKEPRKLTIDRVEIKELGETKDRKPVVYFQGSERGLVLNQVNGNTIAEIAGSDDFDDLPGTEVVLFQTKTQFGAKQVPCVRVRPVKGSGKKPTSDAETTSEDVAADDDDAALF